MIAIDWHSQLLAINPKARAWLDGKRTIAAARDLIGISRNSKMPSWTLAIPAREACPRGGQLAKIEGTVCHGCYAAKGLDALPVAAVAKQRRWDVIKLALESVHVRLAWVEAFTVAMKKETHFRWHSAGDLFSAEYAQLVRDCIVHTPHVAHWIPTREKRYAPMFDLCNVVYRVSDDIVDQLTNKHTGHTSGVHSTETPVRGIECGARYNNGECGSCRACWDREVQHVSYHLH